MPNNRQLLVIFLEEDVDVDLITALSGIRSSIFHFPSPKPIHNEIT
jgi:hypothetical protein